MFRQWVCILDAKLPVTTTNLSSNGGLLELGNWQMGQKTRKKKTAWQFQLHEWNSANILSNQMIPCDLLAVIVMLSPAGYEKGNDMKPSSVAVCQQLGQYGAQPAWFFAKQQRHPPKSSLIGWSTARALPLKSRLWSALNCESAGLLDGFSRLRPNS